MTAENVQRLPEASFLHGIVSSVPACSLYLHLQNDLYCVGWGVKLYSLTHSL